MKDVHVPPTREASVLLNEAINIEERCEVCFRPTKEEVNILAIPNRSYSQHTLGLVMHA
jgi:hypothetical protein